MPENNQDPPRFHIPVNITHEHILKAIKKIDAEGFPEKNASRKYNLLFENKNYPPKIVLSQANKFANGDLIDVSEFSGGKQFANKYLKERGFEIRLKDDPNIDFEYESHSWKIISDTIALKRMDRSSFKHRGTEVPVDIRYFFSIDSMNVGERKDITLFPRHSRFQSSSGRNDE